VSRIIFTNQKGGVGKTTLTREVGITLSELGMRVLLVDCDPQGNLSKSFEVEASGPLRWAHRRGGNCSSHQ
jgi:chromosome partitioning protein